MKTHLPKLCLVVGVFILSGCKTTEHSASPQDQYETVLVPSGEYTLHIPNKNFLEITYIEKHVVFEKAFRIGKFEVTNKLWDQCFKNRGCSKPAQIEKGETSNSPVVRVNWHDAYQFSRWYSKHTNHTYRLPTEEEWVYSAYQGLDHTDIEINYDYSDLQAIKKISKRTKPVGTFLQNEWGMSDFHGNVWEWTLTCWSASEENILKKRPVTELNSPHACTTRIAQGENRSHIPDFISDTYSGGCATLTPAANLGFRLIREIQ